MNAIAHFPIPPILFALGFIATQLGAAPPTDEASAITYLRDKKVEITQNAAGHAVKLMSRGTPTLTAQEYALIGWLTHLEDVGLNGARLADDQWSFLKSLTKLKRLSIWHGHEFTTLTPFSNLSIESLTVGGCMGLRDKNQDNIQKFRDAVLTLKQLPNLKRANLYHSPLTPDDAHLRHIVNEFPKLEDLRLDFSAPRGTTTSITPAGLASLQSLSLSVLSLENAKSFGAQHFTAIAGIKSLRALAVDSRREPVPIEGVEAFKKLRPDVELVVSQPGDTTPPRLKTIK